MPRKPMTEEEAMAAATALTEKQTRKLRKRPDLAMQTVEGDNSRFTQHTLHLMQLPAVPLDDEQKVAERIAEYFTICQQDDMKPSVASFALALGYDRNTVWKVANGVLVKPQGVVNAIKRAYLALNAQLESYMGAGKLNPVTGIFLAKNHFGYTDKTEVEVSAKTDAERSPDELAQKYADAIPCDVDEAGAEKD